MAAGLTVLMSTYIFPGPNPAKIPPGPPVTASRASVSDTMVMVTWEEAATSRGVSFQRIPISTSHWARDLVRL